jgi:hypothetical protein
MAKNHLKSEVCRRSNRMDNEHSFIGWRALATIDRGAIRGFQARQLKHGAFPDQNR